jgi:hypothetical protein
MTEHLNNKETNPFTLQRVSYSNRYMNYVLFSIPITIYPLRPNSNSWWRCFQLALAMLIFLMERNLNVVRWDKLIRAQTHTQPKADIDCWV